MVKQYPSTEQVDLLPLFNEHGYLYAIPEALLKESLGEAFVDEIESPSVVLLKHGPLVFLTGDVDSPVTPELLEMIPQKYLIFVSEEKWEEKIKSFWGEKLKPYPRTKFSSDGLDIEQMREIQKRLPDGMVIEKLTTDSIHNISNQAKGIVLMLFPSLEQFLEHNYGFCIRNGDKIAALALAATPLYNNEFEIHIETDPEYQRRGLATIVCARLIQYSLENGMTPHWDADNEPSAALAKKLGFIKPEKYNAYFWLDEQEQT